MIVRAYIVNRKIKTGNGPTYITHPTVEISIGSCPNLLDKQIITTINGSLALLFKRSSTIKIGVERVNQASILARTEVNNIVDVAVNCVQIVEQILR